MLRASTERQTPEDSSEVETVPINAGTIHIYTWNPFWVVFQRLTLLEKITEFKKFVLASEKHFLHRATVKPGEFCIIIAPDLIFSPLQDHAVYSLSDKMLVDEEMAAIKPLLSHRSLVIAGTVEYLMEDTSLYSTTSYIITHDVIDTYDKKENAYENPRLLTDPIQTSVAMFRGEKSGLFTFRDLVIGLEICQDHEKETLQKELNRDSFVDLQVLLTAGQSLHCEHVCTPVSKQGLLIQCELRLETTYDAGYRGQKQLETAVYKVQKTTKETSFRARYIESLGKKYDVKLDRQAGEKIGFDTTCTSVSLQLQKKSLRDSIIDLLDQLIKIPQWSQLTVKIPFFYDESSVSRPAGFNVIRSLCDEYYSGTLNQKDLFESLSSYATTKLSEWAFTRNLITEQLYRALKILNNHQSESELEFVLTELQTIHTELTPTSVWNNLRPIAN